MNAITQFSINLIIFVNRFLPSFTETENFLADKLNVRLPRQWGEWSKLNR